MKFTVVFPSRESTDHSYGLVFDPCVMWVRSGSVVLVINPHGRSYLPGSVRRLLSHEHIVIDRPRDQSQSPYVVIIPHMNGSGTEEDYQALVDDLHHEKFWVRRARTIQTGQQDQVE